MRCPKCEGAMEEVNRRSLVFDRCTVCGGSWVERTTLAQAISVANSRIDAENALADLAAIDSTASAARCPGCEVELRLVELEGVEIDYCARCTCVFLDPNEMKTLAKRRRKRIRSETPYSPAEAAVDLLDIVLWTIAME